ncbi:LysR family transcriptional regulator [Edaphobacter sp. HDX4]|uniref:LysR family transcriptional regulator n=1 Tax=Edaphobacter sp. HDX4 TaxID=2794064 RepID=UPI002FE56DFF
MSEVQFRNIDLNLLIPLKALLHERNVTRAAKRIHLSQSAMSRALDRLRSELGDELLVRVGRNYELTPRGTALMSELGQIMPRLARLWEGEPFSPAQSEAKIRLAMTDDASSVVLPQLAEILGRLAPGITLEVVPWHERTHEDSLATQLILSPLAAPATFRFEPLFEDSFVCVAGRKLKRGKGAIAMKEYLSFRHVAIETQPNHQNLIDRSLAETGLRRLVAVHLPYFQAAIRVLEATDLVLTMPARIAEPTLTAIDFPLLKAPKELPRIRYSMVWHPRFDSDLLHTWIRETVRQIFQVPVR